jgi:hypothetical protein
MLKMTTKTCTPVAKKLYKSTKMGYHNKIEKNEGEIGK